MDIRRFRYMTWAKAHYFDAEISLVPSGMAWPTTGVLQVPDVAPFDEVPCSGEGTIQEHVARACGTGMERVLATAGSTMANHHVLAATLEPGDEVLVETPAYELFACLASLQGIAARTFPRVPAHDFDLDPAAVAAALTDRTKLVVMTSVHNPTGRLASVDALRAIGELCEERRIWGLVSEVYVDFADDGRPLAPAIHPRLLSTNSLTKVYGLGSVRIGWLLGAPEIVARCHEVREIVTPLLPALPVAIAIEALGRRDELLAHPRRVACEGRAILTEMLADARGLRLCPPQAGIMSFVEVEGVRDTFRFADWLREEHGVGVVPGEHFGAPGWLRVGYGGPQDELREGLSRLIAARRSYSVPATS